MTVKNHKNYHNIKAIIEFMAFMFINFFYFSMYRNNKCFILRPLLQYLFSWMKKKTFFGKKKNLILEILIIAFSCSIFTSRWPTTTWSFQQRKFKQNSERKALFCEYWCGHKYDCTNIDYDWKFWKNRYWRFTFATRQTWEQVRGMPKKICPLYSS